MRSIKFLLLLPLVCVLTSVAAGQWFDQQSIRATVLIERRQDKAIVPHGTGFLLWNYASPDSAIVVTCAHLLRRDEIFVRLNADSLLLSGLAQRHAAFIKIGDRTWEVVGHSLRTRVNLLDMGPGELAIDESRDIGVFLLNIGGAIQLQPDEAATRFADIVRIPASAIRRRSDIALGDELYFIGFPLGIGTGIDSQIEPLIRSGSVAWLSPDSPEFLIDALSYGGNSGSPVFSKAIFGRKRGEASWDSPYLVGMIFGHWGPDLEGVLTQPDPQKPTIKREYLPGNFGLARCIWIDDILGLIGQMRPGAFPGKH